MIVTGVYNVSVLNRYNMAWPGLMGFGPFSRLGNTAS